MCEKKMTRLSLIKALLRSWNISLTKYEYKIARADGHCRQQSGKNWPLV